MNTPWGRPDQTYPIADGVTGVNTPSHGGILVYTLVFDLDPRLKGGLFTPPYGTVVPFEEDVDAAALLYVHPHLLPLAIKAGYLGEGATAERIAESVGRWHPTLLQSRKVATACPNCQHADLGDVCPECDCGDPTNVVGPHRPGVQS